MKDGFTEYMEKRFGKMNNNDRTKEKILEVLDRFSFTETWNNLHKDELAQQIENRLRYDKDPKRIPKVVQALEDAWKASPEQRLGQFIYTISTISNPQGVVSDEEKLNNIFNRDDKNWVKLFNEYHE